MKSTTPLSLSPNSVNEMGSKFEPSDRISLAILVLCLLISGASALVYQVAWTREFRLVFGATTQASASTVALVMAGIGLGNLIFGGRADRLTNPFRTYALLELGILISAACSPYLIDGIRNLYVAFGGQSALGSAADAMRLIMAAFVLLLPATLMGGTLPVAACAVVRRNDDQRRGLAWLYGGNTLGAVVGTLVANFFTLPHWGTRTTLWSACGLNLLGALLALAWSYRIARQSSLGTSGLADVFADEDAPKAVSENASWIYAACAMVGFVYFSMEIVWLRMLAPLLGGTTFTFGLVLAIALAGIGIGAWVYPFLGRWGGYGWRGLAFLCGLEALTLIAPMAWGDGLAIWAADLQVTSVTFYEQAISWSWVAGIVVLPTSVVAGIQFPMLIAALGKGSHEIGRQVGIACAANTLGAVVGSLLTGFVLLPWCTATGLWRLNGLLLVGLAVMMLRHSLRGPASVARSLPIFQGLLLTLTCLLLIFSRGPTAVWRHAGIGAGRSTVGKLGSGEVREGWIRSQRRAIVWEIEGREASVALHAADAYSFSVNGKTDGNAVLDADTQIMLGLLGPILRPTIKDCLVVGLGTGETAGWLASVPGIQGVDVVEIEPAMVEVSKACASVNQDVLNQPKVNLILEDAREVLLTRRAMYDLIVSEPSNPYRAGIANLFTREFYQGCRQRLRDQGLFIQWLQAYEVDSETVDTVLATLKTEFKSVEMWQAEENDLLLVCTNSPTPYSIPQIKSRLQEPIIAAGLKNAWRADDPADFWARYLLSPTGVEQRLARFNTINTDDLNLIEYGFARTLGKTSDFSMSEVAEQAILSGYDLPPTIDGTLDADRIVSGKQLIFLVQNHRPMTHLQLNDQQKLREQLFQAVWMKKPKSVIALAKKHHWQPTNATERVFLAMAAAEIGDQDFMELLLPEVRKFCAAEAELVTAVFRANAQDYSGLLVALENTWQALAVAPWMEKSQRERVYQLFIAAGSRSQESAQKLYMVLGQRLMAGTLEDDRRVTRCRLGVQVSNFHFKKAIQEVGDNYPTDLDAAVAKSR